MQQVVLHGNPECYIHPVYGTNGGTNGGKRDLLWQTGPVSTEPLPLNVHFNDTVDQAETDDASVQASCSGKNCYFVFASTATNPLTMGIHLNHGTSIDNLKMTSFEYSVK